MKTLPSFSNATLYCQKKQKHAMKPSCENVQEWCFISTFSFEFWLIRMYYIFLSMTACVLVTFAVVWLLQTQNVKVVLFPPFLSISHAFKMYFHTVFSDIVTIRTCLFNGCRLVRCRVRLLDTHLLSLSSSRGFWVILHSVSLDHICAILLITTDIYFVSFLRLNHYTLEKMHAFTMCACNLICI